jgi:hypothetical protein
MGAILFGVVSFRARVLLREASVLMVVGTPIGIPSPLSPLTLVLLASIVEWMSVLPLSKEE